MPTYTYDENLGTLIVAHDGREVYRVANLPGEKVKETLQAFLVRADDGRQFAFVDDAKGFEVTPEPALITPLDCHTVDCPLRTNQEAAKGLE